ncbi:MAG TPA: TlpA disulfide reductase family protein [Thermoleophilia bacterium]|nr:TlpA disulfide reductase family protein [Thermoleophilia bacterium]
MSGYRSGARGAAATVGAAAIVLVLAALAVVGCGSSAGASSGGSAQTLTGSTLKGGTFDLATVKGKPTVINFFASWCGPCNQEAPEVVAFAKAHPDVQVVGVATNDKPFDSQSFVSKYGITYPVVMDLDGSIGNAWGVTGIPTTFFIDSSANVQASIVGASTQAQFEDKLKSIQ